MSKSSPQKATNVPPRKKGGAPPRPGTKAVRAPLTARPVPKKRPAGKRANRGRPKWLTLGLPFLIVAIVVVVIAIVLVSGSGGGSAHA